MRMPAIIVILAAAALQVACTSQKDPAEKAVAKIEAAINEVRNDAQVYAADQLSVNSNLPLRFVRINCWRRKPPWTASRPISPSRTMARS